MKIVQQTFTITASKQQAASVFTPASKVFFQMKEGGSGLGWIGLSTMSNAGADNVATLDAATASVPGAALSIEDQGNWNGLDISQYYIHGANAGDKLLMTYHQS